MNDLIGCSVISDKDEELGFIKEVWHQPHHDIWVLDGFEKEILIPAVKEFVLDIDTSNHIIRVKYIEGLWD